MKKVLKFIFLFLLICFIGITLYFEATISGPKKVSIRREEIVSAKIPASMDGIRIVFFSDVHYGTFVDESQLEKIVNTINSQQPDIVLFGGDLFDHPQTVLPSETAQATVGELLASIEAPLGKFAVLGDHDLESSHGLEIVSNVLQTAEFEILNNQALRIRNRSGSSIVLTGLENGVNGNPDPNSAFGLIQSSDFTIVFCHTPDTFLSCSTSLMDLFLAGHSHGGQVVIPFIGHLYQAEAAEQYYRGRHEIDGTILDISNGVGTSEFNARFLADQSITVYTLKASE